MEISSEQMGAYDLVKVSGRVDSFTAPKLGETVNAIIHSGRYKIILDLERVDYISSAGLRVLIDAQKTCKHSNRGELILVAVPRRIYETLELAGFVPLFRLCESIDQAAKILESV